MELLFKSFVKSKNIQAGRLNCWLNLIELKSVNVATGLQRLLVPCPVYQNPAHGLRSSGEEMAMLMLTVRS